MPAHRHEDEVGLRLRTSVHPKPLARRGQRIGRVIKDKPRSASRKRRSGRRALEGEGTLPVEGHLISCLRKLERPSTIDDKSRAVGQDERTVFAKRIRTRSRPGVVIEVVEIVDNQIAAAVARITHRTRAHLRLRTVLIANALQLERDVRLQLYVLVGRAVRDGHFICSL